MARQARERVVKEEVRIFEARNELYYSKVTSTALPDEVK